LHPDNPPVRQMPRDYRFYMQDMANSIDKVYRYTEKADFEMFSTDEMLEDAVVRNLWIIADAANNVPSAIKERYPAIDWRDIHEFRNVMAHTNFGIDLETIWDIVRNRLPPLREALSVILKE
ncbi:MAG: DUF86 domain-containing protein, partial [Thermoplasmata archaeon]